MRSTHCLPNAYKKWQIRDCDKDIIQQTKLYIQEKFRNRILLVDISRPGSGNTNNGNTARRFFKSQIYLLFSLEAM